MKHVNPGIFLRTIVDDIGSSHDKTAVFGRALTDLRGTARIFGSMLTDPLPMTGRLLLDILGLMGISCGDISHNSFILKWKQKNSQ